jgi:hypothetical protein
MSWRSHRITIGLSSRRRTFPGARHRPERIEPPASEILTRRTPGQGLRWATEKLRFRCFSRAFEQPREAPCLIFSVAHRGPPFASSVVKALLATERSARASPPRAFNRVQSPSRAVPIACIQSLAVPGPQTCRTPERRRPHASPSCIPGHDAGAASMGHSRRVLVLIRPPAVLFTFCQPLCRMVPIGQKNFAICNRCPNGALKWH